jgi:hypothetical protein
LRVLRIISEVDNHNVSRVHLSNYSNSIFIYYLIFNNYLLNSTILDINISVKLNQKLSNY